MPNILTQFQHNAKHIFRRLQVSSTGDSVPDGLNGADKVLMELIQERRDVAFDEDSCFIDSCKCEADGCPYND